MRIFAIRDEAHAAPADLAYLIYFTRAKRFYIELPGSADPWLTPFMLDSFVKRGEYTVNAYFSKLWVEQRIIPPDRQNLGQILKANGLKEYDEFALLELANGRCAQDECYIAEIRAQNLPNDIRARMNARVEDVLAISNQRLMVFFRNGETRIVDARPWLARRQFSPVYRSEELFRMVGVQPGGYGVYWGDAQAILYPDLYKNGVSAPITLNDMRGYISQRVINTARAAETLGCTRQYINELVKRAKLKPVHKDAKYMLLYKSDIERRESGENA